MDINLLTFFLSLSAFAGILDTRNSSSMETLIDPTGSKNVNYAYKSSVISDDEFINAVEAVAIPQQQRPMLPPPQTLDNLPSPPQLPNDVSVYNNIYINAVQARAEDFQFGGTQRRRPGERC